MAARRATSQAKAPSSSGPDALTAGLTLLLCLFFWATLTSFQIKLEAFFLASAYSLLEYSWYSLTVQNKDGSVTFNPLAPREQRRKGFTSVAQWWANVLFIPVFIHGVHAWAPANPTARIFLAPLVIWGLEIVEGAVLVATYGENPAWRYTASTARWFGQIDLAHWKLWLVLGAGIEGLWALELLTSS